MTNLYFMWAFIAGLVAVLVCYYIGYICAIYKHYRKAGLTRKQAFLVMWDLYVQ